MKRKIVSVILLAVLSVAVVFTMSGCEIFNPAELFRRLGDNTYVEKHDITSVEIGSPPDRINYEIGDSFSSEGMTLKVYYDDGLYSYEKDFDCSIDEGAIINIESGRFEASFEGWTVTQDINIALPDNLFSLLGDEYITLRMEAEDSEMTLPDGHLVQIGREGKTVEATNHPSGDQFVARLSYAQCKGSKFAFRFQSEKAGWCVLSAGMGSTGSGGSTRTFDECLSVTANGVPITITTNPSYASNDWQGTEYSGAGFYNWTNKPITVFHVNAGENILELYKPETSNTGLNWDYIELSAAGALTSLLNTAQE